MQLVASLSFFRHFISKALRLGVVVLALFAILLSSLAPSGRVYAVCEDPADCESDSGYTATELAQGAVTGAGVALAPGGIAAGGAAGSYFFADKTISLLITALAAIYAAIGRAIGYMIPIVINILINVLNYNSFGDSFIVTVGWPIMRDLLNMSVILILLVIAIRTMVGIGGGAQGAQQAIGRVFFAVVLLNFSKTITLLLIDASQVVMLTFVNALDVATGNFVELFQVNSILSTSWNVVANVDLEADTANAVGFLVNSFLSTFLLAIVLMTLVILGIVFLYRIVVLWMLVVLSPVFAFFYGLGDTLPGTSGAVDEWRKKFVGALTIGPILSFFLWLSLAAASQGAVIAETEGFTFFENETASTFLEIFQPGKLLSLGLGIMLLVIGMQLAASSAASLGEFSGNLVGKLPGWSAKLAKMSTLGVAKFSGAQIERRTGVGQSIGKGIGQYGASIQGGRGFAGRTLGAVGLAGTVGAAVAGAGGRVEKFAEKPVNEAKKASRERVNDYKGEQLAGALMAIERGFDKNAVMPQNDRDDYSTVKELVALNPGKAAESISNLKDQGIDEAEAVRLVDRASADFLNDESAKNAYIDGDSKKKDEVRNAEVRQAHLLDQKNKGKPERIKKLQKLFSHPKFNHADISEVSLEDADVVAALAQTPSRPGQDGRPRTKLDDLMDGQNVSLSVRDKARRVGYNAAPAPKGVINEGDIIPKAAAPGSPPDPKLVGAAADRVIREHISVEDLKSGVATPIIAALNQYRDDRRVAGDINGQAKAMAALASGKSGNDAVLELNYATTGSYGSSVASEQEASSRAINIIVTQRVADIRRLDSHVGQNTDLNNDVVDSISDKAISRIESELRSAVRSKDTNSAQAIEAGIKTLRKALVPRISTLSASTTPGDEDELKRMRKFDKDLVQLSKFGPTP